jgi:flagellar hook-associated protein 1 FlgK
MRRAKAMTATPPATVSPDAMSFAAIRSIATSALMASQVRMQVTSSNIANADVEGYTRKTAVQTATNIAGAGTGTAIVAITSDVDKYLLADVVAATTALGAAATTAAKTDALQAQFGSATSSSGAGTSLADTITDLEAAIIALSGTAESTTLSDIVVGSLDAVAAQLRETSTSVQDLRAQSDLEIADAVAVVNEALDTIAELNSRIVAAKASGQSTADLEDLRNTALKTLSAKMDISYIVKDDGQMRVSTTSGTPLVDASVHHLDYVPAAMVTADTVFGAITVGGKSVTDEITSGSIGALVVLRDETLADVQATLDALAVQLISALNSAHNSGTSLPAPVTLTGTTAVSATDTLGASGTMRIALTDASGQLTSYADIELSSIATVGDLVDALNGVGGISASVASGTLVIASTSGAGVSIADIDSSIGGAGFAGYFGLNDLLTGSNAATIRVRSDILSGTVPFSSAVLDTTGSPALGDTVLATSSALVTTFADALSARYDFGSTGNLHASTTDFAGYAARIVASVATGASTAASRLEAAENAAEAANGAFSSLTGVNIDEETARLSELQQYYSVAAQLLEVLNAMFDALLAAARS